MTSTINAFSAGSGGITQAADASGILQLQTNSTAAVTIDTSQNVGIGTTSPLARLHAAKADTTLIGLISGTTKGVRFGANSTYSFVEGVDNTGSVSYQPITLGGADIRFSISDVEKMRIDSSGTLLMGATSTIGATGAITFLKKGGVGWFSGPNSTGNYCVINQNDLGVYVSTGGTSWTANSDERLKDIIEPIADAANKVSTLRAVIGKYKTDEEGKRRSFLIAQDVQAVLPEAVSVGTDSMLGVQYTEVIPLLVAAIKEQQALIIQLQADVAALKGA